MFSRTHRVMRAACVLVLVGTLIPPRSGFSEAQDQLVAFVAIATHDRSLEYGISRANGVVQTTLVSGPGANEPISLNAVTTSLSRKRQAGKQAAAAFRGQAREQIEWASLSPDGSMMLVTSQDPLTSSVTSAGIFEVADLKRIASIDSSGYICDSLWSRDSKSVVLLEVTESMKKTPWGLLAALSGHPIEIQTYYLEIFGAEGGPSTRVKVAEGIPNGTAELRLQQ